MAEMQGWEPMRRQIQDQLERQTGSGLDHWVARIAGAGLGDEAGVRAWLGDQGVTGYPQTLLVWETYGYPEFLLASADELVERQYQDRVELRPILDAVLAAVSAYGAVTIQARKTYVSLVTPRRTFAVVAASTRRRVDLGLRLAGVAPAGTLLAAPSLGNEAITVRLALGRLTDLDEDALGWLRRAYDESC